MRITDVTTAVVEANFDYTFVRIHTDGDLYGTGEAFMAPGLTATIRDLGQVIVGQDPLATRILLGRLLGALSGSGGSAGSGMGYNAFSGIEAALWDLRGKAVGSPVAELLGGPVNSSIEVYADLHAGGELVSLDRVMRYRTPAWGSASGRTEAGPFYWEAAEVEASSTEALLDRADDALRAGFSRLKFDLDVFRTVRATSDRGATPDDLVGMANLAERLRSHVGPDVHLAFDCHWRFDIPTSIEIAKAIAPARPIWLEDPVPPDPVALARVAAASPVPIATGENTYRVEGFEQLVNAGATHVVTPDVQKTGGILETVRIGELAARHFVPIAPHCIASPVGFMAAVHACAVLPNTICLEFHGTDVPFWDALILGDTSTIAGGRVSVPTTPGLGVELDMEVVRRYAAPGEPVFLEPPAR